MRIDLTIQNISAGQVALPDIVEKHGTTTVTSNDLIIDESLYDEIYGLLINHQIQVTAFGAPYSAADLASIRLGNFVAHGIIFPTEDITGGDRFFRTDLDSSYSWDGSSWQLQAHSSYDQVAIVPIRGRDWATVNLGVAAYTADFSIMQVRNTESSLEGVMDGATDQNQLVDTTKDWRLIPVVLGIAAARVNSAAGIIQCSSDIQAKFSVGDFVQNLRTMEIGRITGFPAVNDAAVAGFTSGHLLGDIFEFHSDPDTYFVHNITLGLSQRVAGFNPAAPDILPLIAPMPGQAPGDSYVVAGVATWQWDEAGYNVMINSPSYLSNPPGTPMINIHNKSAFTLEFIVRWRG
jgi:hypothetical protein